MKACIRWVTIVGVMAVFVAAGMGSAHAGGCKGLKNMPTITMKLHVDDKTKKECARKDKLPGENAPCPGKKEGCSCRSVETITVDMNDVTAFHGHLCPGSSLGYRACQIAFAHLYPGEIPPRGDQFVVSGAARACPNEAISFITGARYGKASEGILNGNMAFDKTLGDKNMTFIFASMSTGKAVKLISTFEWPKEFGEMKAKAEAGDPEAKETLEYMTRCLSKKVLTASESDAFTVTPVTDFSWKEYKEKYMQ